MTIAHTLEDSACAESIVRVDFLRIMCLRSTKITYIICITYVQQKQYIIYKTKESKQYQYIK